MSNKSKVKTDARIAEIEKAKSKEERRKSITKIAVQVFAVVLVFGMLLSSLSNLLVSFLPR